MLLIHYVFYIYLVIFSKPELSKSTGLHEPTGDCNATSPVQTASGLVCTIGKLLEVYGYKNMSYVQVSQDWYVQCHIYCTNYIRYVQ